MASTGTTTTQSEDLAIRIRSQIVEGRFAPGKRLPTFQEIETRFNVSRGVAQLAMERLKRDGFINSQTRRGLYVVPHPPHLKRYGIVFPDTRTNPSWSRFDEALVKEAARIADAGEGLQFELFAGTSDHREGRNVCDRLRDEVHACRLAGLIMAPGTFELASEPPLNDPRLPKVYVFSHTAEPRRPVVGVVGKHMVKRALEWLKSRDRSRVAVVNVADTLADSDFDNCAPEGLVVPREWRQEVGRSHPQVVKRLIPLLMDYPAEQRPDGLFIADDNLVEYAVSAVVSMGLRVGVDLDIVAHCNWPWPVPSPVPMRRIGYHAGHMLDRCLKVMDAQRAGEPFEQVQTLPALFESEAQ